MGLSIKWDITYRCNLNCTHCINGYYLNNEDYIEVSLDEIKEIISNISSYKTIEYIHFLGGEPLIRKDFFEIADYLQKMNIKFGFNTNSLLFKSDAIDRLLSYTMLNNVIISLEAPSAEVNEKIRGKKVFNIALDRIKYVQEYKIAHVDCKTNIIINTVLCTTNYQMLDQMIEFCNQYDINELNLLSYIEGGNGTGKKLSLNFEQQLETLKVISKAIKKKTNKVNIVPKHVRPLAKDFLSELYNMEFPDVYHGCGTGVDFLFIDNKGKLYPCDRWRSYNSFSQDGSTINQDNFSDIWNSAEYDLVFSNMYSKEIYGDLKPCNSCTYLHTTCFPCHMDLADNETKSIIECMEYINKAKEEGVILIETKDE